MTLLQAIEPVKAVADIAKASNDYGHESVLIAAIVVTVLLLVATVALTMKKSQDRFDKLQEAVINQLRHGGDDNKDGTQSNAPSLQSLSESLERIVSTATLTKVELSERMDKQEVVAAQLTEGLSSLRTEVEVVKVRQEEMSKQGCTFRTEHEPLIRKAIERVADHGEPAPEAA